MRFSKNWLREFISISSNSKYLCNQLSMLGMEVNSIKSVSYMFSDIIIGEILNFRCLSDVNNLYLFRVHIGNDSFLNIINKNFFFNIGTKIAVATTESVLSNNLCINVISFNDLVSDGIFCSYHILGIEHDNLDVIVLPDYVSVGEDISNYFDLDDKIIDISINYNRYDCYNIFGIARELSIFSFKKINEFDCSLSVDVNYDYILPVTISNNYLCPIYLCRVIKNININSIIPIWMSERLRKSDIKLVNPVIDIINYVFLEFGLFVNVFDLDLIDGGVNIRLAKCGDEIVLFDNSLIKLDSEDLLVVEDNSKIISISGIVNNKSYMLSNNTKNLFLECAFFSPDMIKNFIFKYKINTGVTTRIYFQDVNYLRYLKVVERITYFILHVCGGEIGPVVDISDLSCLPKKSCINLSYRKLNSFVGSNINYDFVIKILKCIGCKLDFHGDNFSIIPPSWRYDIFNEQDLIEEVMRFYGYDNIPIIPIKSNYVPRNFNSDLFIDRVKTLLIDKGYYEVINYSFVNHSLQSLLHPKINSLSILNPFSSDKSVMRISLLSGLLTVLQYNNNHQQNDVAIFEFGTCFIPEHKTTSIVNERLLLSGLLSGSKYVEYWDIPSRHVDFYDLKGVLESILSLFYNLNLVTFKFKKYSFLHPGKSAAIYYQDICIGYIGVIHPCIVKFFLFSNPVILFELYWDKIFPEYVSHIKKISVYPVNRRDISLIIDDDLYVIDIINACKESIGELLVNIYLFDVYLGNDIFKGFKSISIAIFLQSFQKTLTDREISDIVDNCVYMLQNKFKVKLRS